MSNYTKSTNFATKDNLTPGDPLKVVRGTEIDTEYNNIATAIATKTDNASAAITGGTITGITDLAVADGGTGASTAAGALNNLLPSQTSAANKYLQSDGTNASWDAVSLSTSDITGTLPVANGGTGVTSSTGTGSVVLSNSPTLVTPALGTPASGVATNLTGLPISTGVSGLGTGVATFLGTPSSANLASAVTDETGTGSLVFATSPTLVTPALGTPSALVGTNITGTASGLTAGNVTTNANLTGAVTSSGNATSLGSFSSANLLGALTDETGTGSAVFATSPTLVTPVLGTPTSATLTNATGLPLTTGVTGTLPTANGGTNLTSFTSGGVVYASSSSALATGSAFQFNGTDLGLGVTPSVNTVSGSGYRQIEVGTSAGNMVFAGGNELLVVQNAIYNSGFKYAQSTQASYYRQNAGEHQFFAAPTGTAGNAITFSQYMTLTAAGNLGIGETSPASGSKLALSASNPFMSITGSSAGEFGVRFKSGASDSAGVVVGGLTYNNTTGENRLLGPQTYNYLTIYTSNSERVRVDASGNLGLGVTPSAWGSGTKAFQVGSYGSVNTIGGIDVGIANNAYNDGTNWKYIASQEAAYLKVNRNTFAWNIAAAGSAGNPISFTQAMTLNASGGLQTLNTIGVGNATPSTSGAGITFPATQSASSDANTLDDYEEGTFTPEILNGLTGTTYTTQTGVYTKIGRLVQFQINLNISGSTLNSNQLKITGLPFNAGSSFGGAYVVKSNASYENSSAAPRNVWNIVSGDAALEAFFMNGNTYKGTDLAGTNPVICVVGTYIV